MKLILAFIFLLSASVMKAQNCDRFPADCPDQSAIQTARDSDASIINLLISREITMENRLRAQILPVMEAIGKARNWEMYEFTEESGGGAGKDGQPLPFPLRPPHGFSISFVFIVDPDSLQAWKNWYNNELPKLSNDMVNSLEQARDNSQDNHMRQNYSDSAQHYASLKTKYMTDHASDYQKALLANDQKGIRSYEDRMKKYDDRINAFIEKANGSTQDQFSASENQNNNFQAYRLSTNVAYRNASILRVKINFNADFEGPNDYPAEKAALINPSAKPLHIRNAALAITEHNIHPDNEWGHSSDLAFLLFGKWDLKYDEYYLYHAAFTKDKKNLDAFTVKQIPSDKVQTIAVHVEGGPSYIDRFLQSLDTEKLYSMILKD
jgi:hypothetical protein